MNYTEEEKKNINALLDEMFIKVMCVNIVSGDEPFNAKEKFKKDKGLVPSVTEGKWYKEVYHGIEFKLFLKSIDRGLSKCTVYGLFSGEWENNKNVNMDTNPTEMTPKEVHKMLVNEWEKHNDPYEAYIYDNELNLFTGFTGGRHYTLFNNGKWFHNEKPTLSSLNDRIKQLEEYSKQFKDRLWEK